MSITQIVWPTAEPITLNDAKLQLGFGPMQDSDRASSQILNDKLRSFIVAARMAVEDHIKRVLITQAWVLRLDGFPGISAQYERKGYPQFEIPKPPLQSIASFRYIDVGGTPRVLTQDATFGVNPSSLLYSYQLERGSETQPGRVLSSFARPWPPARMVPANVIVEFRCGYGGPINCSVAANSTALSVSAGYPLAFNADDAPQLPGEIGLPIVVPGAGADGAALNTHIASVNPATGAATLSMAAASSVTNVAGWAGYPIPAPIINAIKFLVEDYYDNAARPQDALPQRIAGMLKPYVNYVV